MHVDFNCLFEKGRSFEVPEVVPFRLTHNITDAFGPLKIEGTQSAYVGHFFKWATNLYALITRKKILAITNLESFVFDPLLEWNSNDLKAKQIMGVIDAKLSCSYEVDKRLEPVGIVLKLTKIAIDPDYLSKMYIGWGAFL